MVKLKLYPKESGKDLIKVGRENTYRIADHGKLKYEQRQKQRQQKCQHRLHKIKEIRIRPVTDSHDLETKIRRAREFLNSGLKTKVTLQFKGRQIAFQDIGRQKLNEVINAIVDGGIGVVDSPPKLEGRNLVTFIIPASAKTNKK